MKKLTLLIMLALSILTSRMLAQDSTKVPNQKESMPKIALKELEDFHHQLHPLVHEAYPNKNYAAMRTAMPELLNAGKKVEKAKLPKEFSSHRNEFTKHSRTLVKQLQALVKKSKTLTEEQYGEKFMEMHETFEALANLLK
jgi:hypothetical protein